MAYRDLTEEFSITEDVMTDWASGSSWTFRKHLTDNDEIEAAKLAYVNKTHVDPQKAREALRRGEQYQPEFEQEVKANAQLALLQVMSVRWDGPEFEIPAGANDPHAGGIPPCDIRYMNILQLPHQLEDVYARCRKVWSGRSPAEQADFREGSGDMDVSDRHGKRASAKVTPTA